MNLKFPNYLWHQQYLMNRWFRLYLPFPKNQKCLSFRLYLLFPTNHWFRLSLKSL